MNKDFNNSKTTRTGEISEKFNYDKYLQGCAYHFTSDEQKVVYKRYKDKHNGNRCITNGTLYGDFKAYDKSTKTPLFIDNKIVYKKGNTVFISESMTLETKVNVLILANHPDARFNYTGHDDQITLKFEHLSQTVNNIVKKYDIPLVRSKSDVDNPNYGYNIPIPLLSKDAEKEYSISNFSKQIQKSLD